MTTLTAYTASGIPVTLNADADTALARLFAGLYQTAQRIGALPQAGAETMTPARPVSAPVGKG